MRPASPFLRNGIAVASDGPTARSGSAEQLRVWRSPVCEKRSAERAGRSGAWEGTCGVSRMCPDKPPSCYASHPTRRKQSRMHDRHVCLIDRRLADISTAPNDLGGGGIAKRCGRPERMHSRRRLDGSAETTALFFDCRRKDSALAAR